MPTVSRNTDRPTTSESGFAAIWLACVITLLMLFMALAIDQAYWYYQGWRQQQAADQAALSGATFLPDDPQSAVAAALKTAKLNGFTTGISTTPGTGPHANRISVTINQTHDGFFSTLFRKSGQLMSRQSTAEYNGPLSMGSPNALLGNDPESSTGNLNFWLSQHAPYNGKSSGDRYSASRCDPAAAGSGMNHPIPYACQGQTPYAMGSNPEFLGGSSGGYRYQAKIGAIQPGADLVFEIFDGVDTDVGPCEPNRLDAFGNKTYGIFPTMDELSQLNTGDPFVFERYSPTNEWCTGDLVDAYMANNPPMVTTVSVQDSSGVTVAGCTKDFHSYDLKDFSATDPISGSIAQLVNPTDGIHDNGVTRDSFAQEFFESFRKWSTVCRIPASQVTPNSQYYIRTQTDSVPNSAGTNQFSLRVNWDTNGVRSMSNLSLAGYPNLPVYINFVNVTSSNLYVTKVPWIAAGKNLKIDLFDLGDTNGGTVNLQILPPNNSNLGATWACTFTGLSGSGTFTPASTDPTTCSINGLTRVDYNGTLLSVNVPIPSTYQCNQVAASDCWAMVKYTLNNGAVPTDRTTWTATVAGDPLRLIH